MTDLNICRAFLMLSGKHKSGSEFSFGDNRGKADAVSHAIPLSVCCGSIKDY